jgi:pilus assembly protein Flp/PilA
MWDKIKNILREDKGQGLSEYGLIIALIAVVLIITLTALSGQLRSTFENITNALSGANKQAPGGGVAP